MRLGEKRVLDVKSISTGCPNLDEITGVGGIPLGRVTEISGNESSGKTTICLQAIANAQHSGKSAAIIDSEFALDTDYAHALGVEVDALLLSQPQTGEQALEVADMLIRSKEVVLVIIDSVAGLLPRAMLEGDYGDASYGGVARLMSQSLSKLKQAASENDVALIFTNQLRVDIGGYNPVPGQKAMKTFGGEALKFFSDLRIRLSRKKGDEKQQLIGARIIKNKLSPPFRTCEFTIRYGVGTDAIAGLLDVAIDRGIIEHKGGGNYTYGEHKWRGKETVLESLRDDEKLCSELTERIRK